jgi:hypothetical protein
MYIYQKRWSFPERIDDSEHASSVSTITIGFHR